MLDWSAIQQEYDELIGALAQPTIEVRVRAEKQKRASQLAEFLEMHRRIEQLEKSIAANKAAASQEQGDLRALYEDEVAAEQEKLAGFNKELEDLLYPADERDERSIFLEIRAGAGGQEASLFAAELFRMYNNYALAHGWEVSIVEASATDLGGYKELIAYFKGKKVYKFLKFESGVHRVQRVPKTEGAGRVHTSTVTVAVLSEADEVEVSINPNDLRIDVFRASGAGGQHVNTTDSAVRITHIPTGLVVSCQDERSQIKNKAKGLKVLQARLFALEKSKREAEESAARKQQVGTGERAEKIRTYNFPQNRITDHRIDLTLKKLDLVMEGDLDDIINPLLEWDSTQRRAKGSILNR